MNQGLSFTRLPYHDPAWNLRLQASNGLAATVIEFYTWPENLRIFARALAGFPRKLQDQPTFEIGSDNGDWAYHIYLRAYCFDGGGHSALELLTDNHDAAPDHARVHFSIRAEAASLNRLGRQLAQWLEAPDEPLEWNSHHESR